MPYNNELLRCCHWVWRQGYKRQKALDYCESQLGYRPNEETYKKHFFFVWKTGLMWKVADSHA